MNNLFEKYVLEGKEKTNSLKKRLGDIESVLLELRIALLESDIEIVIEPISNNQGVGFKTDISTDFFMKKFITVTMPKSEREAYILERNGDLVSFKTIDDLVARIGSIISSVSFWHEVENLKKMDENKENPF